MAIDGFFTIRSIAYGAGWEVEPQVLADGRLRLSSALHSHVCYVQPLQGRQFMLSFDSQQLITELETRFKEFIGQPLGNMDLIREILREASKLASTLPDSPVMEFEEKMKGITLDKTTAIREVEQRVGQDIYRKNLLRYWGGECALTRIGIEQLLVASHAKPWKDCESAEERLNVFNGFLLEARYDRLFDQGFISFTDDGELMISRKLDESTVNVLGLSRDLKLRWVRDEHLPFLHWHQQRVFLK